MGRSMSAPEHFYEHAITRDQKFDTPDGGWVTIPRKPLGIGWEIADADRDRHTVWRRLRPSSNSTLQQVTHDQQ